jgi:hypothetical protein
MKAIHIATTSLLLLTTSLTWAQSSVLISDEKIPIEIKRDGLICSEARPDGGFGSVPATIRINTNKIADRTHRVGKTIGLYVKLPSHVTCLDLDAEIKSIPNTLTVRRVLKRISKNLSAKLTLEIPVNVDGKNLILTGNQSWMENSYVPHINSYVTLTHPQSATSVVGLACMAVFSGSSKHNLSVGSLGGRGKSNVAIATKTLASLAECEDIKNELLKTFKAIDPGNHGTPLRVTRELKYDFRYIIGNRGEQMCQQIEIDKVTTNIENHRLTGMKVFPIKTVSLVKCFANI